MNWNPQILEGRLDRPQDWPPNLYFSPEEMRCKQTRRYPEVTAEVAHFLTFISEWRECYGEPMRVTSGFRHRSHFIEAKKIVPGAHAQGVAVDIAAPSTQERFDMLWCLYSIVNPKDRKRCGIGISTKKSSFIHVDLQGGPLRPAVWTY